MERTSSPPWFRLVALADAAVAQALSRSCFLKSCQRHQRSLECKICPVTGTGKFCFASDDTVQSLHCFFISTNHPMLQQLPPLKALQPGTLRPSVTLPSVVIVFMYMTPPLPPPLLLLQYLCLYLSAGKPGNLKKIQTSVTAARKIFRIMRVSVLLLHDEFQQQCPAVPRPRACVHNHMCASNTNKGSRDSVFLMCRGQWLLVPFAQV